MRKSLVIILLAVITVADASAQGLLNRRRNNKDSIAYLNTRLDSLQRAYDELSALKPIDMVDSLETDDEIPEPGYLDPDRDTDSLLSVYYVQNLLANTDNGDYMINNPEDTVYSSNIPDSVYIERLKRLNPFVNVSYNDIVRSHIVYYTQKISTEKMANIIGLSFYYLPLFEEIFDEYGLPLELKAMAVIESAFNPKAVSRAKAKGMWQFMYTTAKMYNLNMNSFVDERFDPIQSCRAAARYLRDAYDIFGDWSLAIASYNCGPGNVNKAIRRAGCGKYFWDVYKYLPRETRGYVPAFIAALYTLKYYPEHGIVPVQTSMPAHVDTFHVRRNLHFRQISDNINITLEDLRDLNPQYIHDIIPGNEGDYILRLPYNCSMEFVDKQDSIYTYKDSIYLSPVVLKNVKQSGSSYVASGDKIYHKVTKGQTLGGIASKYHTTVANIKKWNNLKSNNIQIGQRLVIYGKGGGSSSSSGSSSSKSSSSTTSKSTTTKQSSGSSGNYVMYTVRKGDTLWEIANKHSVSLHEIMTLNGFSRNTKIYPGMKIKIKKA